MRLFISTTTVLIHGVLLKNAKERLHLLHNTDSGMQI